MQTVWVVPLDSPRKEVCKGYGLCCIMLIWFVHIAKKEAKQLEKLAKAAVKVPVATSSAPKKDKEKKEKKEVASVEEWVNPTPKGEKKGRSHF